MKQSDALFPTFLHTLRRKMNEDINKLLESYSLTQMHIPYLMVLCHHREGLSQKDMIEKIQLDKAHASRALKELIEKGILIKEDKKTYKNKYFLSDKGLIITDHMKKSNRKTHESVFSILSDEEKSQLDLIIKKLTDHIMENKD